MLTVRTAAEFMRQDLITSRPKTPVGEGIQSLLEHAVTGTPVVDDKGNYLGMFSERCVLRALKEPAEAALKRGTPVQRAPEFMARKLLVLRPELDVFQAIDQLLDKRVSGAPVLDSADRFQGIFSEKTAMHVLINAAYDQVPGGQVGTYMNPDQGRVIDERTSLLDAAEKFLTTPYRRLPVLRGDSLLGQVSRRDVVRGEDSLTRLAGTLPQDRTVEQCMDMEAMTITPQDDLLRVAKTFFDTNYRRLPVLDGKRLVGQVSRRDVLRVAADLLRPEPEHPHAQVLYLSPLLDCAPPEIRV